MRRLLVEPERIPEKRRCPGHAGYPRSFERPRRSATRLQWERLCGIAI
jgi:hypothetical protein